MTQVNAVVVNWNGANVLGPCLSSLRDQRGTTVLPLVIDNGSTDGSAELLARDWPEVEVVSHHNNLAAANNHGVGRATTDFVLLINPRATLDPDALRILIDGFDEDEQTAAVAPRVLRPDGQVQTLGIEESDHYAWSDLGAGDCDPREGPPQPAFALSGCCVLFRKKAWDQVGGQDEDFHMGYENVDLSLRLRAEGYTLYLIPNARCERNGHGSDSTADAAVGTGTGEGKDILRERNRLLVIARHFPQGLPAELVRSPWFAHTDPKAHDEFFELLAARVPGGGDKAGLLQTFARGVASLVTRDVVARENRTLLQEREDWIAALLQEVAKLRIYRLPSKRLKPMEQRFLEHWRQRQPE